MKLILEEDKAQLKEALRIHEEKIESLQIEETECNLLEMKVQALEEEKQRLLNSFETERKIFEDTLTKKSYFEKEIEKLNKENTQLRDQLHKLHEDYEKSQGDIFTATILSAMLFYIYIVAFLNSLKF